MTPARQRINLNHNNQDQKPYI